MEFKKIKIKNFRNFEDIDLNLANKNIFFGLNDVGKTNFLYALRYVFDRDIRRLNFLDSDYHNKNINQPVEILVSINIKDTDDKDSQKLRAQLKGALLSQHSTVYIKLIAEFDHQQMVGIPMLYWGGDLSSLQEMKQRGYLYEIDYVFNVIYIDSYVDLYSLFKKNIRTLVKGETKEDEGTLDEISRTIENLNTYIASLSGIKNFEEKITPEYNKYRDEGLTVSIKSEIAVKGLFSNIIPYIKQNDEEKLYPTSGDGRRKLLVYSIYDLISNESEERKINLFLIEEPENNLHKAMQIALSKVLFANEKYQYLFVSTHSPFILYEMDEVNLIRIYSDGKITSSSKFYKVPETYVKNRKTLNRNLAEAIFANRVLLVEGPSEQMLYERILEIIKFTYEVDGIYVLAVGGIMFENYCEILDALSIFRIVKTDNDLRHSKPTNDFSVLGFSRINSLAKEELLPTSRIPKNTKAAKRVLYKKNIETLNKIRTQHNLYLSRVDLENDLDEVIHNELVTYLGKNPVKYLQESKHYHMAKLVEKLSDKECLKLYQHDNFACLRRILE